MTPDPTLLLVDDDAVFRERLARALRERGFAVTTASDGKNALACARLAPPDMVLVDLNMPGIGGVELVRALHELHAKARLIVLTGYGSIATALESVRAGAADYLTKPADADQIAAALHGRRPPPRRTPAVPTLDRVEWEHIQRVLAEASGNVSEAARRLGLDRRSLQRKLAKFAPPR